MKFHRRVFAFLVIGGFLLIGDSNTIAGQWSMPPFTSDHGDVELVGFLEYLTTGAVGNDTYDPGSDLFHPIAGVSGHFAVTVIGWEAGHRNVFRVDGTSIFDNRQGLNFGSWVTVDFDAQNATFKDTNNLLTVSAENPNPGLELWTLDEAVTLAYLNDFYLPAGAVIAGFNDNFADSDHDDMIMAYTSAPEISTMLLLGSGLIGLVVVGRRKFRKK